MPKFKVRVINTETIVTEGIVEVSAKTIEDAHAMVDEMVENSEIYDDGNWEVCHTYNEVERKE